jgi:tRNA(Ser,Leu) C12 N-acetylase TAN1
LKNAINNLENYIKQLEKDIEWSQSKRAVIVRQLLDFDKRIGDALHAKEEAERAIRILRGVEEK